MPEDAVPPPDSAGQQGQPQGDQPGAHRPGELPADPPGEWQDGAGHEAWDLPWAEPFTAGRPERARLAAAFGAATRRTGSLWQLMGQAAADRIGLNATDLNCLNILSFSGAMTAGELARATGLTTASITGVTDRLEQSGFVRRERDPKDRRRVVIRLVLDKALREVAPVFQPMIRDWLAMTTGYTDDELRLIVEFYGQMEQVIRKHLLRLRGPADTGDPPGPGGSGAAAAADPGAD
jgi:DNA-binding MarR family transcriptional regulator